MYAYKWALNNIVVVFWPVHVKSELHKECFYIIILDVKIVFIIFYSVLIRKWWSKLISFSRNTIGKTEYRIFWKPNPLTIEMASQPGREKIMESKLYLYTKFYNNVVFYVCLKTLGTSILILLAISKLVGS